jgi:hypothetical protein
MNSSTIIIIVRWRVNLHHLINTTTDTMGMTPFGDLDTLFPKTEVQLSRPSSTS